MNRRHFLCGLIGTPAIVAASNLMPLKGIVMPLALPAYDLTPSETWALLHCAPRRTVEVPHWPGSWAEQNGLPPKKREEIFVLGRWFKVGRTDLKDNVSTWRDGIKTDDFRPAIGQNGMKAERILGARLQNFGNSYGDCFDFIDSYSDG